MNTQQNDLGMAFESLMNFTFIKYEGVLIERDKDKFKALHQEYDTLEDAKKGIDQAFIDFGKRLNSVK